MAQVTRRRWHSLTHGDNNNGWWSWPDSWFFFCHSPYGAFAIDKTSSNNRYHFWQGWQPVSCPSTWPKSPHLPRKMCSVIEPYITLPAKGNQCLQWRFLTRNYSHHAMCSTFDSRFSFPQSGLLCPVGINLGLFVGQVLSLEKVLGKNKKPASALIDIKLLLENDGSIVTFL